MSRCDTSQWDAKNDLMITSEERVSLGRPRPSTHDLPSALSGAQNALLMLRPIYSPGVTRQKRKKVWDMAQVLWAFILTDDKQSYSLMLRTECLITKATQLPG